MAYIETIEPATGRRESLWVMLSIALILFLGAVGLHFNSEQDSHSTTADAPELTPPQRQLVMELSIALPEISYEQEESGQLPTIDLLNELEIAPFSNLQGTAWQWQLLQQGCYLATPQKPEQGYFLFHPGTEAIYMASEAPHTPTRCGPDHEWITVSRAERKTS